MTNRLQTGESSREDKQTVNVQPEILQHLAWQTLGAEIDDQFFREGVRQYIIILHQSLPGQEWRGVEAKNGNNVQIQEGPGLVETSNLNDLHEKITEIGYNCF